ncbi:MAG: lipopolysaccharide heptosyltransferase II [Elusimicrobia bacterium RIFOXYA2_FULL_40_6]|nr:MAG: lipopolysaccharide heptosyltransferase II [Elusimicrobia bacterium RIFOXYA2_FULL_40_6]
MNKILIIKPSGIGDIVHSLPVVYGLKKLYPEAKIDWLVFSKFAKILNNIPQIDELIQWDRQGGFKEYREVIKLIRAEKYDLLIDLQGLMRTAIISYFSGAKIKVAVSLLREFAWLLEKPVEKFDPLQNAVDRNYGVVKSLSTAQGKEIPSPAEFLPWIHFIEKETKAAEEFLSISSADRQTTPGKPFVGFVTTSRGLHKVWPGKNFTNLIKLALTKYDFIPVFLGMKGEEDYIQKITAGLNCEYVNLTGKTDLRAASAVIARCKLVIGNDTALIHIAAALGVPVIGLYGATDPAQVGPYGEKNTVILNKLSCWPCGIKSNCRVNRCMMGIYPEDVFTAMKKYL